MKTMNQPQINEAATAVNRALSDLFKNRPIQSFDDNDLYKFTMQQAVFSKYPDAEARYEFVVRSDESLEEDLVAIRDEINALEKLALTDDQARHFQSMPFFSKAYISALRDFRFEPQRNVRMSIVPDKKGRKQLKISVVGSWFKTILYEVMILAIVSEVRNRRLWGEIPHEQFRKTLFEKVEHLKSEIKRRNITNFQIAEMGTRRRFSSVTQRYCVEYLARSIPEFFVGTSNVMLARELGMKAIGTVAHEYTMAHQAFTNVKLSQRLALQVWDDVFDGRLGIALTDTIGSDAFLPDFTYKFANSFQGVRHDSGCPYTWGEKFIAHYESLGIDPMTKTLVFTDGLDFDKCLDLCEYFAGRINVSFGIGTFLSADMGKWEGENGKLYKALSIVMKLVEMNGQPLAKISDEPEKAICESEIYLANLRERFGLPQQPTPEKTLRERTLAELGVQDTAQFSAEKEVRTRVQFLKNKLIESRRSALVLGISGGVDSTATGRMAQIAVDELNREFKTEKFKFVAVRLPAGVQLDENDAQDALKFINPTLTATVNVGEASDAIHQNVLTEMKAGGFSVGAADFHKGNVKARMRMIAQYELAAFHDGLVIGTDHNAEAVTGFFTKYGDGACDLVPLRGLNKRQVRMIAKHLGAPESLFAKAATADLEEDKPQLEDEAALGLTYEQIDDFLEGKKIDDDAEDKLLGIYAATAHKRSLPVEFFNKA